MPTISCPHCGSPNIDDGLLAGQLVMCAACRGQFVMPKRALLASIAMASGKEHEVLAVLMFDIGWIRKAEALRKSIQTNFSGFTTGIGFIGTSFTNVVLHSMLLGAAESLVSDQMAKTGFRQLEAYYGCCMEVRNSGAFIALHQIENVRVPMPATWRNLKHDIDGAVSGYMLFDDPCIAVETPSGVVSLMWDKVEEYRVREL